MDEVMLTKDAYALLSVLYKDYLQRRKSGQAKRDATYFGNSHDIHKNFMPGRNFIDVDDACRELSKAGFLVCLFADCIAYEVTLTDEAIFYMENRFKNGMAFFFKYLEQLRSLLPW